MDSNNKLSAATASLMKDTEDMAIVEVQGPGIWMQKCIYAPMMPQWANWEKMVILEASPSMSGTSDLFWDLTWFPCPEGCTLEELEVTVRALYPQFPPEVYEIHRLGAP